MSIRLSTILDRSEFGALTSEPNRSRISHDANTVTPLDRSSFIRALKKSVIRAGLVVTRVMPLRLSMNRRLMPFSSTILSSRAPNPSSNQTTTLSGAATAVCNVGPGLGPIIGPAGNFSSLPDAAKWLLTIGMLLGRLEILTVLVLITPVFWRY